MAYEDRPTTNTKSTAPNTQPDLIVKGLGAYFEKKKSMHPFKNTRNTLKTVACLLIFLGPATWIYSQDRVGVNNNTPRKTLDVEGSVIGDSLFVEDGNEQIAAAISASPWGTSSRVHINANQAGNLYPRITIGPLGCVGIGQTFPAQALDVNGNVSLNDFLAHNGDIDTRLAFLDDEISLVAGSSSLLHLAKSGSATTVRLGEGINSSINFANAASFYADNGFFGIGTLSPQFTLDVRPLATDNGAILQLTDDLGDHFLRLFPGRLNDPNPFMMWSDGDPLRFATNAGLFGFEEKMRIQSDGSVGIGTATPEPSAKLHVESTTQGFLPPRMVTFQRDSMGVVADGLMIFNVGTGKYQFYDAVEGRWYDLKRDIPDPPVQRSMIIPAAAFHSADGADPWLQAYGVGGAYVDDTLWAKMVAPVSLPVGSTVTSMTVYYKDNAPTDLLVQLTGENMPSSGFSGLTVFDVNTSGASNTWQNQTVFGSQVLQDGIGYFIEAVVPFGAPWGANLLLKGVKLTYTEP